MTTTSPVPEVGEVVDLRISWGNQVRTKCARCKRFFSALGTDAVCPKCGTVYAADGDRHRVVSAP